jgi:hypothetical protein
MWGWAKAIRHLYILHEQEVMFVVLSHGDLGTSPQLKDTMKCDDTLSHICLLIHWWLPPLERTLHKGSDFYWLDSCCTLYPN